MSLRIFETEWKKALASILKELTEPQFRELMSNLDKIPQGQNAEKHREEIPDIIIQVYGPEGSISVMDKEMKDLQRNDARVQEPLQRFVKELKERRQKLKEKAKKTATESGSVDKKPKPAAGKKRKCEEEEEEEEEDGMSTDQRKSRQSDNERNAPWKKSIRDLKSSTILETEGFVGKVVQKSGLRPYQTKDKARKCFFYLAVADETDSVKMKVYGKDRFEEIKEESSYLFSRCPIREGDVIIVTTLSKVCQTRSVDVPEELEMEATRLIYPESPVYSVEKAKQSADKTKVSVEGTITEIDPVGKTKVHYKRQKVKTQSFHLKDETGSIRIVMWDEGAVGECRRLSVGDVVKLANMKTHKYFKDVSLNSTASTRIIKVQSVGVQSERIEILGIKKATKKETQLEAEMKQQLHTFVVATRLLAKTVGFKVTGDFRGSLLDKLPFSADAEIRGNEIITITAASKV